MSMLPDGTFDVFVVNAAPSDDESFTIELALVTGEHKGDVVTLRMRSGGRDPIAIVGLPGTLTVADGRPSLRIDT